jgi:DNA-directed RNA polymerase subunit RPC12/RpoP
METNVRGVCYNYACEVFTDSGDVENCSMNCIDFMPRMAQTSIIDSIDCPYCGYYIDNGNDEWILIFDNPIFPIEIKCQNCEHTLTIDEPVEPLYEVFKSSLNIIKKDK